MNPKITNIRLLDICSQDLRFGARKVRQWACPRFIPVVSACIPVIVSRSLSKIIFSVPSVLAEIGESYTLAPDCSDAAD
jgi:hypothetical protein